MDVNVLLTELLETDARLDALKHRRSSLRSILDTEARRRYADEKAVPSWKVPRLGSATLAGTDSTETEVTDAVAYARWAREDRPESVVFELAIPATAVDGHADALAALEGAPGVSSTWSVHPGVLSGIVASGRSDLDAGRLIAEDGQFIPGVVVRRKDPYLSVRLMAEAKRRALAQLRRRERARPARGRGPAIERVPDDVADAIVAGATPDIYAREAVGAPDGVEEVSRPLEAGSPEWYADLDDVFGPT